MRHLTGKVRNVIRATGKIGEYSKRLGIWDQIPKNCRREIERYIRAGKYIDHRTERRKLGAEGIKTMIIPAVQIFLFRNGQHGVEVFLGKRAAGGFQGQWCVPAGRKDKGESYENAALRELNEETGLSLKPAGLVPIEGHISQTVRKKVGEKLNYEHRIKAFIVWAGDLNPVNMSPHEHETMEWMPISQAIEMHESAVEQAAAGIDDDSIVDAIPSGALGIIKEFRDYSTIEEAADDLRSKDK